MVAAAEDMELAALVDNMHVSGNVLWRECKTAVKAGSHCTLNCNFNNHPIHASIIIVTSIILLMVKPSYMYVTVSGSFRAKLNF